MSEKYDLDAAVEWAKEWHGTFGQSYVREVNSARAILAMDAELKALREQTRWRPIEGAPNDTAVQCPICGISSPSKSMPQRRRWVRGDDGVEHLLYAHKEGECLKLMKAQRDELRAVLKEAAKVLEDYSCLKATGDVLVNAAKAAHATLAKCGEGT